MKLLQQAENNSKIPMSFKKNLRQKSCKAPSLQDINSVLSEYSSGNFIAAEIFANKLVSKFPNHAFGWKILGAIAGQSGRYEIALKKMSEAARILPSDAEIHNNLGIIYSQLDQLIYAEESCMKALQIKKDYPEALNTLGAILQKLGRLNEAKLYLLRAIELNPKFYQALNNLGNVLRDLDQYTEAEQYYRTSISIAPDFSEAHNNLAANLQILGYLNKSEFHYREAIRIKPTFMEALSNLGNNLKDQGRIDEAIKYYEKALEVKTDFALGQSNLLFSLNFLELKTIENRTHQATLFGMALSQKNQPKYKKWEEKFKTDKLRIGFVSSDLRDHPVGFLIEGLLRNINLSKFDLFAFSATHQTGELTRRVKQYFKEWISLVGTSDLDAAQLIYKQKIDILIDLSGHTAHNRLPIFAFKPAPVQISWLGYFATTGLPEIDYILGDPHVTPHEESGHFTEKIWQLPESYFCFTPPDDNISIMSLPVLANGYITFGCFNNYTKINNEVKKVWAKILHKIPKSKLFIKTAQLNDPEIVLKIIKDFSLQGITSERLILEGNSPRSELLASYNRVDIALDPFPYPGGTTSAEALWMGVPVLTLKGDRFLSHVGETIAYNVGHPEWISKDLDDYVAKAVEFSNDLKYLSVMRNELRNSALQSPLFDSPRFAANFGNALQEMWRQYLQDTKD
jgi:predicted O-linked N-acetylglucosamine transferase (SPINDLY family)